MRARGPSSARGLRLHQAAPPCWCYIPQLLLQSAANTPNLSPATHEQFLFKLCLKILNIKPNPALVFTNPKHKPVYLSMLGCTNLFQGLPTTRFSRLPKHKILIKEINSYKIKLFFQLLKQNIKPTGNCQYTAPGKSFKSTVIRKTRIPREKDEQCRQVNK